MDIYMLVITDGYDAYEVQGVFSSERKALAAQDPLKAQPIGAGEPQVDYYVIVSLKLDAINE